MKRDDEVRAEGVTNEEGESLSEMIEGIRTESTNLVGSLTSAAQALRERGHLPGSDLIEAVRELRSSFESAWARLERVAEGAGVALDGPGQVPSLGSLDEAAAAVTEALATRIGADVRAAARGVVRRMLSLRPPGSDGSLLEEVIAEAERVRSQLEGPDGGDIARMLVDGHHPLAALDQLLQSGDTLSNEQWDVARARVAEAFTPKLATAAARGRLAGDAPATVAESGQQAQSPHESGGGSAPISPEEATGAPRSSSDDARPDDENTVHGAGADDNGAATGTAATPDPRSSQDQPTDPFGAKAPLPAVDDAIDPAMGHPPSVEERAAQLAGRALAATGDERAHLSTELVWRLIAEGQLGLARGLDLTFPRDSEPSHRRLPHWLLTAVILGKETRDSTGPIAQRLEMGFLEFADDCFLIGEDDWNGVVRVLMVSAALQPAILAPSTGAPAVLHGARLEDSDLHELKALCELIAKFGDLGQPLDPNCIKDVTAQVDWHARLDGIRTAAQQWRKQASLYTMVYAPATQVWRYWLKPGGQLRALLEPVCANTLDRADWLRNECVLWQQEADIGRAVQRTFSAIKPGRRLRIEATALRQIVSHVGEVMEIAEKWLSLLDARPEKISGYIRQQAQALRTEVMGRRDLVEAELGAWQQGGDQLARSAAVTLIEASLDSLHALLEPSREFSFEASEPRHLLSSDLLRSTSVVLDESWEPSRSDESLEELLRGIAEPFEGWSQAFGARVENLDLEGSSRIIELLTAEATPEATLEEFQEKQEKAEQEAREAFDRDLRETRGLVERALASGLLRESERNDLAGRIEMAQARLALGQDFLGARSVLEEVRTRVSETRQRELSQTRQRLETLGLPAEDDGRIRIEDALARGDAWTAHEYLDRVERGTALPKDKADRRAFSEFWPDGARKIAEVLPLRGVSKGLRAAIGTRVEFGGLRFDTLETEEQHRARDLVKAWLNVRKARSQVEPVPIRVLLQALGFEEPKVEKLDNARRHTWVHLRTEPVSDRRLIPMAHFGSKSGGRLRVLCLWDEPSDEDLVHRVGDTVHGAPVIVFYFGLLSEGKRRSIARLCLDQHRSFVVVDELLMAFLAAERGARLPVLFACSLPFTWLEPFATTAGLVPPEMFYGRREERAEIESREGSCFIYGGRQLGKTALLKDVERTFHDPDAGLVAKYLDLKRMGIGYDRSAGDLWGVVTRELKLAEVIPTSIREQARHETIEEAIGAWLDADPGRRILLLLDEADEFLAADGRDGWKCSTQLKGLMDETERRFKVVFAGLHNVQRSVRSANHPLAHYGRAICIGPLIESGEWSDARELIQGPLEAMGFEFESQDLITRILSQTNYFPSLLQLYGQQLLRKLADPRSLVFDERRSPPSMVTEAAVDDAYESTRESIRQRVQWTLQLDPRYEVLAYSLAMESMSGSDGAMKGHTASWFRDEALLWWSAGFSGERGSYDAVHAILDEMVGLGVFRESDSGQYAFRSPNVVSLLGTQMEIEKQLERDREDPVEYAPSRFRRPDPNDASRRSPLTVEQEESLRRERNGVSVVFGWELAGLPDLPNFLRLCLADELLARRSLEGLGNGWAGAPEQRGKEFGEVDEPLSCGADDAGEDLLGLRAAGRPITAADFAVDDGGANGVLGTPVGGLHLGRPQEGEHGGELAVEMGGEALGGRQGGRRVEESPEAREQAPAGHGEAVLGDRVRLPSITEREGVGEDRLHASRPRTARMIRGEGMRSAHQVRQTRLMQRRGEAAIRRPPVSHQDAVKVGAQHLGRLVEATPVANAIHRGLRRRKRPQPVPHRADPPAGLVGAHDGTAADLCAQRGVGRGGHAGRAMQHLHEPPGRHRQPEALPQECGHLGEGHADLLVQARNQGDGARPQVDVGGPHRVRGLQRMAALHAAPALGALPDGHIKAPDNRPDDGEIFLVLRRHALQCHRPAAPRTRRRERGLVGRINPGGNRATRPASIPTAGPPPRPPAPALGPIFGERCGLTEPRAPRGTE